MKPIVAVARGNEVKNSNDKGKRDHESNIPRFRTSAVSKLGLEEVYPYCYLPEDYFRRLARRGANPNRRLLSVSTWDGREILSVKSAVNE